MAITVTLCDVPRANAPLLETGARRAVETLLGTRVEACGVGSETTVAVHQNAFLVAAWHAYAEHRPLVLTPDAVWLCIAQGFAAHMRTNAEALRGRFVRHQGRLTLCVRRDDFVAGSPDNPWPDVFAELSRQIAEHIGRQRDLVVCDFSTTGPVERAASELVLMDAMQQYFDYRMRIICGIPAITLEGTVDDWKRVRQRAQMLAEYDLEWWTSTLVPILDEFIATASGRPRLPFWRQLFGASEPGMCGIRPEFQGWIFLLFPYLTTGAHDGTLQRNPVIESARGAASLRPDGRPAKWISHANFDPESIPLGLSQAPLAWEGADGKTRVMDLIGGFMGVAQDPRTLAVRPTIGWAVREQGDPIRVHSPDAPASAPIDHGIFLNSEAARCSRAATRDGRLLLARTGLYFIPGGGFRVQPRPSLAIQVRRVPGAIHVAPPELFGLTRRDVPAQGIVVLELSLTSGERLGFSLSAPPAGLDAWLAEVPPR